MRGILIIISSPSGAGKTTLTRRLLDEFPTIEFSVSYTTRPQRIGEHEGVDYHFVDVPRFESMVNAGEFAEWFFVHGNRYGTARAPVEAALARGRDVVFDVDWQGGAALSKQWPDDSLKIFVLPPDLGTLADRLRRRATDAPDVIERRLRKAIEELGHYDEYDHLIVNDDLDRAYRAMRAVYLVRRWAGRSDAPLSPAELAELTAIVDANRSSGPDRHARQLIAAS